MADPSKARASLEIAANFPAGYFLENLAMRSDGSLLVTVLNKRELWYVPPAGGTLPVEPMLLRSFQRNTSGLCEIAPDVFLVAETDFYGGTATTLHRVDLAGWTPGRNPPIEACFDVPSALRGINGMCLVAPGVVLAADHFGGAIWRIDFGPERPWSARPWLRHWSMDYFPGAMKPEQPGVNGVRYATRTSYLYYSSTAKKLLMRVHVDPWRFEPDGEPTLVVAGRMGDDFCIDEEGACLYLTTHRENTIDRVSMDPAVNSDFFDPVVGNPFDDRLIGPSSVVWGRAPDDMGRVFYATTDGGTASPAGGGLRDAKLLRITLPDR